MILLSFLIKKPAYDFHKPANNMFADQLFLNEF